MHMADVVNSLIITILWDSHTEHCACAKTFLSNVNVNPNKSGWDATQSSKLLLFGKISLWLTYRVAIIWGLTKCYRSSFGCCVNNSTEEAFQILLWLCVFWNMCEAQQGYWEFLCMCLSYGTQIGIQVKDKITFTMEHFVFVLRTGGCHTVRAVWIVWLTNRLLLQLQRLLFLSLPEQRLQSSTGREMNQ